MEKRTRKRIATVVILAMLLMMLIPTGIAFAKGTDEPQVDEGTQTETQENVVNDTDVQETEEASPVNEDAVVPENTGSEDPAEAVTEGETSEEKNVTAPSEDPADPTDPSEPADPEDPGEPADPEDPGEPEPEVLNGFYQEGEHWVYYQDNEKVKGFLTIEEGTYYFSRKTGYMLKGKNKIKGATYYFDLSTGKMKTGFIKHGNYRYYFDKETGKMAKGFTKVGKYTYYFNPKNGHMRTGFRKIGNYKFYFNKKNGRMVKGFKKINGNKYYFGLNTGRMFRGFHRIKGHRYYFGKKSGKMFTGLHKIGKKIYTFDKKGRQIRVIDTKKKAICLTWDDGPSENTTRIMKCLVDNKGRGTFFVCGNRVDAYSSALKKNFKAGNQIGNHTWSHPVLSNLSAQGIKKEISSTNKKVKKYTGKAPTVCRTPYGINTEYVRTNVNMPIILWSVDTLDWKTRNADSTYNSIMNSAKDGAVVLMHDLYSQTADAAVRAIPALRDKGFQLVTVEEMAMIKGIKLKDATVYYNF